MNKDITIQGMPAFHSWPDTNGPHAGLIVIHEIWGLTDHIKDVSNRFAGAGYTVVAPNLFHDVKFEGKVDERLAKRLHDPATKDEAQKEMRAAMAPIMAPEFAAAALTKLKECVDYLLADAGASGAIGVVGFCFGGTYSFHLAAGDQRIQAAAPFYGQAPKPEEIPKIQCPILAFYGEEDAGLMKSLPQLKLDMERHGRDFNAVVYPNAGHAFFNDTNDRMYRAKAAKDAWEKTLAFLGQNLLA